MAFQVKDAEKTGLLSLGLHWLFFLPPSNLPVYSNQPLFDLPKFTKDPICQASGIERVSV